MGVTGVKRGPGKLSQICPEDCGEGVAVSDAVAEGVTVTVAVDAPDAGKV
jgi:hypothetical protein